MSIGLGIVIAIVVVAVVVFARAIRGVRRRAAPSRGGSPSDAAQAEDATGYVPGVWMLGGAESAAPHDHADGHRHGADTAAAHAADPGGGQAGSGHGRGRH